MLVSSNFNLRNDNSALNKAQKSRSNNIYYNTSLLSHKADGNNKVSFGNIFNKLFSKKVINFIPENKTNKIINGFKSFLLQLEDINAENLNKGINEILGEEYKGKIIVENTKKPIAGEVQTIYSSRNRQVKIQMPANGPQQQPSFISINPYSKKVNIMFSFIDAVEKTTDETNKLIGEISKGKDGRKALKKYSKAYEYIKTNTGMFIERETGPKFYKILAELKKERSANGGRIRESVYDERIGMGLSEFKIKDKDMALKFVEDSLRKDAKAFEYINEIQATENPKFKPFGDCRPEFYNDFADYIKNTLLKK